MRIAIALAVALLAPLVAGSVDVTYPSSQGTLAPNASETHFGKGSNDSDPGENETNATADIPGTLLSTTDEPLFLNNTNATSPYFARFEMWDTGNLVNLDELEIGIDNGTDRVAQVVVDLGGLVKTGGKYVRLEPGSTNRLYVTRAVSSTSEVSTIRMDVFVADDLEESAVTRMRASIRVV